MSVVDAIQDFGQPRTLTCGVEVELELELEPKGRAKHAKTLSRLASQDKHVIVAAILNEAFEKTHMPMRIFATNEEMEHVIASKSHFIYHW